jgi:predicted amidohydrolase
LKVAAYQAQLLAPGSLREAMDLVRECVARCESAGISILCCPEAILGGLADYCEPQDRRCISLARGELDRVLSPLRHKTVTSIVGFTELASDGNLYNSAAVLSGGQLAGIYRKHHPARRRSVYSRGQDATVFRVGGLTFGVIICNDSNHDEPARQLAAQGARVLFAPSNNGLPRGRVSADIVKETRAADIARAVANRVWVIRADVAGGARP